MKSDFPPYKIFLFFPHDLLFWGLHITGLLAATFFAVFPNWLNGGLIPLDYALALLASTLITATCLAYRWLLVQRQWHKLNLIPLVMRSALFCVASASLIAGAITLFVDQLSGYLLTEEFKAQNGVDNLQHALLPIYIGNTLFLTLVQSSWFTFYVFIFEIRQRQNEKVYKVQLIAELKDAQMNALQGQINPHFLFNGLNNIRGLMRQDIEKSIAMITALAEVLRASLGYCKNDKVTLRQEIDVVNNFIAIASLQFEEKLNFHLDVPTHLLESLVPPMSVQILVENAIKHGIDKIKGGGDLTVIASSESDQLIIKVINSGTISEIIDDIKSTGTGLKNITNRLELIYGNKASFNLRHLKNNVIASIQIPMESVS